MLKGPFMKKIPFYLSVFVLFFTGCTPLSKRVPGYFGLTEAGSQSAKPMRRTLTQEQAEYLKKYCNVRAVVFCSALIPKNASVEEAKPRLAAIYLGFKRNPTWDEVSLHPLVKLHCTEERRKKFGRIFCGTEKASWLQILYAVEGLRKNRDHLVFPSPKKKINAAPPGAAFFFSLILGIESSSMSRSF